MVRVYIFTCIDCVLLVCLLSYPYSEDSAEGQKYMCTRIPAWCDRILMSPSARDLVLKVKKDPSLLLHLTQTEISLFIPTTPLSLIHILLPVSVASQMEG